jgi:hypothetical protein
VRLAAAWAFTAPDPELVAEQVEVGELEGDRFPSPEATNKRAGLGGGVAVGRRRRAGDGRPSAAGS